MSSGAAMDPVGDDDVEELQEGGTNCLVLSLGSFVSGGLLGGVVGLAGGVFKRQGFKVALEEGGTSAKTFALMSGVHSLVTCAMAKWRKTDDVINQAVAGCASGIALGVGGPPSTMAMNCAGFAAFAFLYELLMAKSALAASLPAGDETMGTRNRRRRTSMAQGRCRTPLCNALNLKEVLSLGMPCWWDQDKGCSLGSSHQ